MASTYTWANALTVAKPYVKSIPTSAMDLTVCDQLNAFIFKSKIWRWSVAALTAITLVDGTQDYTPGSFTGAGFYRLLRLRITRTDTTPDESREISLVEWLAPDLVSRCSLASIRCACWEPVNSQIRLESAFSVPSGTTYQINGEYQFAPIKLTATSNTIIFPDQYFDVIVEGLKWKYYQLGDDTRVVDQRLVFFAMLEDMKRNEDYGDGQALRFPSEPIGVGRAGNPGMFGWY